MSPESVRTSIESPVEVDRACQYRKLLSSCNVGAAW